MMDKEKVLIIARNVVNGVGKHGDFLRTFFDALLRADGENYQSLHLAAITLIFKYGLDKEEKYLTTD